MTAQQKFTAKVSSLSVAMLKEIATKMYTDSRDEADMVLSAAIDALMTKMPEAEFVAFCEEMETA
jgi:hypothetical protein